MFLSYMWIFEFVFVFIFVSRFRIGFDITLCLSGEQLVVCSLFVHKGSVVSYLCYRAAVYYDDFIGGGCA